MVAILFLTIVKYIMTNCGSIDSARP